MHFSPLMDGSAAVTDQQVETFEKKIKNATFCSYRERKAIV